MKIAIRSATILDTNSSHHNTQRNVLIHNARIEDISTRKHTADKIIEARGMILSTGWFDMGTFVGEPGFEHREDMASVVKAAARGGITEIAVLPNTDPPVQSKSEIKHLMRGNKSRLVQIHPMALVTLKNRGEELTEMIDLHRAGAVAFTDGLQPIWNTHILLMSLQYLQQFNGLLISRPEDVRLNMHGQMNEGINSIKLGLKGMPKVAEEIAAFRDIELLRYAGGKLHLSKMSCPKALKLIRTAKKSGLNVSCDIATYQALLDDSLLETFDTNYKVNPPLREKSTLKEIIARIQDDTIDVLTSGHLPQDVESKTVEFDRAAFGMINLQTFAAHLAQLSESVALDKLMEKVTCAPRRLLDMQLPVIEKGAKANLTLFDPNQEWTFNEKENSSKSRNSPWLHKKMQGKAKAVFNNGRYYIDV